MMNISVGDVVMLKSGGPKLTVRGINDGASTAHCMYFYDGTLKDVSIKYALLERIPQNKKNNEDGTWFDD